MLFANAVVGLVQLVIAILFAVVALYIGFAVLGKITKGIDEEKELVKGNAAVGIIVASVFVAIALVVQSGVSGLSVGINKALTIEGPGKVIIGVPGDGVFRLNKSGPALLRGRPDDAGRPEAGFWVGSSPGRV